MRDPAGDPTTAMVVLENVTKRFGSVLALDDLSLTIRSGEFVTLLGPSGSGKTTCLWIVAGMMRPDAGGLTIAGRDVSAVPMHKRNIGMVFQSYSLFPHLSVAQNVAYPLRIRGLPPGEVRRRVGEALEMIRLPGIGDRRPNQLSGGQQQRVALARALVFDPDVLLLDEPLSALDRVLREEMQLELRRVHKETGKTMICVTHDRSEALTMADRIVVMRDGRIVQDDPPRRIYECSNSRFVAEFLGETNVIPLILTRSPGGIEAKDAAGRPLRLGGPQQDLPVGPADYVIRVENVGLRRLSGETAAWNGLITEALFLGDSVRFVVRCDPHLLTARLPLAAAEGLTIGTTVEIDMTVEKPMLFDRSRAGEAGMALAAAAERS